MLRSSDAPLAAGRSSGESVRGTVTRAEGDAALLYMDDAPCCSGVPQRLCPWHRATSDAIGLPIDDAIRPDSP